MATKVASGNIVGCRFVMLDTATNYRALQATAGAQIYGIAYAGTRNAPLSSLDDGYLAIAGEEFGVHTATDAGMLPTGPVLLELSGTVTAGDALKADTGGTGITTATPQDQVGAIAEQSGTTGKLIPVTLVPSGTRL